MLGLRQTLQSPALPRQHLTARPSSSIGAKAFERDRDLPGGEQGTADTDRDDERNRHRGRGREDRRGADGSADDRRQQGSDQDETGLRAGPPPTRRIRGFLEWWQIVAHGGQWTFGELHITDRSDSTHRILPEISAARPVTLVPCPR